MNREYGTLLLFLVFLIYLNYSQKTGFTNKEGLKTPKIGVLCNFTFYNIFLILFLIITVSYNLSYIIHLENFMINQSDGFSYKI